MSAFTTLSTNSLGAGISIMSKLATLVASTSLLIRQVSYLSYMLIISCK